MPDAGLNFGIEAALFCRRGGFLSLEIFHDSSMFSPDVDALAEIFLIFEAFGVALGVLMQYRPQSSRPLGNFSAIRA
jgi:hypothetical protein